MTLCIGAVNSGRDCSLQDATKQDLFTLLVCLICPCNEVSDSGLISFQFFMRIIFRRWQVFRDFSICQGLLVVLLSVLGTACSKEKMASDRDQKSILKEVYQVVRERYALFPVKQLDWDSVYAVFNDKVSEATSSTQLFSICSDMLFALKDGHVVLYSEFDTVSYDRFYAGFPTNFNLRNVKQNYLNNQFSTVGPVLYSRVGDLGYLYYSTFAEGLSENQWDTVLNGLSGIRSLIIDVRGNFGGNTVYASRLAANYFSARTQVKYELVKSGPHPDSFFPEQPFYLLPLQRGSIVRVAVLTNRSCFSACNDFVLYMRQRPEMIQVGDQTGGGGGIPNQFILSNGWKLQYTATMTLSPQMVAVENGIEPDLKVGIGSLDEEAGKDPILEAAVAALR